MMVCPRWMNGRRRKLVTTQKGDSRMTMLLMILLIGHQMTCRTRKAIVSASAMVLDGYSGYRVVRDVGDGGVTRTRSW